jgi:protein phosphatase
MLKDFNMVHEAGWCVDKGLHRDNNEDSVAAVDFELINGDKIQSAGIYAVADGMGGRANGEVASRMAARTAVQQIIQYLMQEQYSLPDNYQAWVEAAVKAAHAVVFSDPLDMGTTLLVAMVVGNQAHIASVGDSRAYLISDEGIFQITHDQSIVQGLVKAGAITDTQAQQHPYRHILEQAIGTQNSLQVDTCSVVFPPNTHLMLCSDGLTGEVDDETIYHVIKQAPTPQDAADTLVQAANASGGHDNIAVVVIRMK